MKVYAKKRSDRKKKWSVIQENEVTGKVKTVASFQFKKDCDDFIALVVIYWRVMGDGLLGFTTLLLIVGPL